MNSSFLALKSACAQLTKAAAAEALARTGLHGAQAQALLVFLQSDGCRIGELGQRLELGKSAVTTLVARMERAGLLQRLADEGDGRASRIALTGKGRAALGEVQRMIAEFDARLTEGFDPRELEIVRAYLARATQIGGP